MPPNKEIITPFKITVCSITVRKPGQVSFLGRQHPRKQGSVFLGMWLLGRDVVSGKDISSGGTQVIPAVVVWIKMACVGSYI